MDNEMNVNEFEIEQKNNKLLINGKNLFDLADEMDEKLQILEEDINFIFGRDASTEKAVLRIEDIELR